MRVSRAHKRSSLCSWFPSLRENWNSMQSTAFPDPPGQWWRSTSCIFGGSCFTLKVTLFIKNFQQNLMWFWPCIQMHTPVHHFHIHTITPYKRDTWPTDRNHHALHCKKKPTKNTHTWPPWHSTHLITNLDNTRHLILRTQILPNLQITFYIYNTKYHRQQPLYNTLELLMMGIVVPETCWASSKICNKNPCYI